MRREWLENFLNYRCRTPSGKGRGTRNGGDFRSRERKRGRGVSWCAWPSPSENNVYEAEKRGRRRRNKRWLPWILRNSASVYLARGAQLSFFLSRPPCLHLSFTDYAISRICFRVLDKLNDGGETRKIKRRFISNKNNRVI